MRNLIKFFLLTAMLVLPMTVKAQDAFPPLQTAASAPCPMTGDMDALKRDVENLSVELGGITDSVSDPDVRERLQKMAEHLALVNARIRKMHDAMENADGGGLMASVKAEGGKEAAAPK